MTLSPRNSKILAYPPSRISNLAPSYKKKEIQLKPMNGNDVKFTSLPNAATTVGEITVSPLPANGSAIEISCIGGPATTYSQRSNVPPT